MSGAAGSGQAAVDMGGLVDAIHVASTGVLGMRGIATRNAGPSALVRLTRERDTESTPSAYGQASQ